MIHLHMDPIHYIIMLLRDYTVRKTGDKNIPRPVTFNEPANTCTCPLKEPKGVICTCNMTSSSNPSQSTRPTGQVLWDELLVLSIFHV